MVNLLTDYTTQIYHALSTDARPTGEPGAQLREIDTGKRFIFDGTSWLELPDGGGGGGGGISGITVLQDITLSAPVRAVQLDIPAGYEWAVAIVNAAFTATDWLYWGLNNTATVHYLPPALTYKQIFPAWYRELPTQKGYLMNFIQTGAVANETADTLEYIYLRGYDHDFAIGSRFLLIGGHYADL